MADYPARRGYDPAGEETGWGSPMPAEYGSLTAFLPPLAEPLDEPGGPERRGGNRRQTEPRWRVRKPRPDRDAGPGSSNGPAPAAAPPSSNGPAPRRDLPGSTYPQPAARYRSEGPATVVPAPGPEGWRGPPAGADPVTRQRVQQERRAQRDPAAPSGSGPSPSKAARPQWAQSRRTVRHLNVWTVAKVSLVFYLLILIAVVVASVMLWYVADAIGTIQSIEKSVRTLFDLSKFTLHPASVATYTSVGGAILALAGTLGNILAALMYNLISDLVGGIRFDVVEDAK